MYKINVQFLQQNIYVQLQTMSELESFSTIVNDF